LIEKAVIVILLGVAQSWTSIFGTPQGLTSPNVLAKGSVLSQLEFGLLLTIFVTLVSMPRRPQVFHENQPVDHQRGASLLALYTFSWASRIQNKALRQPLSVTDLPCVGYDLRSRTLDDRFQQRKGSGRLWIKLLRAFRGPLIHQWLLALLKSSASFGVQVSLHRLLQQLEGDRKATWTWISVLAFCLIAEMAIGCWLQSVSETLLEIPTIAQITLLVFHKSLRRKISHQSQKHRKSSDLQARISEINILRADM